MGWPQYKSFFSGTTTLSVLDGARSVELRIRVRLHRTGQQFIVARTGTNRFTNHQQPPPPVSAKCINSRGNLSRRGDDEWIRRLNESPKCPPSLTEFILLMDCFHLTHCWALLGYGLVEVTGTRVGDSIWNERMLWIIWTLFALTHSFRGKY
jgi:hypothetical protein